MDSSSSGVGAGDNQSNLQVTPSRTPYRSSSSLSLSSANRSDLRKGARSNHSPIVDWLIGDANTPGCVLQFLNFEDIAFSHASCKSFRDYISNPRHFIYHSQRESLTASLLRFQHVVSCSWLPRYLYGLHVDTMPTDEPILVNFGSLSPFSHLQQIEIFAMPHLISGALFEACGKMPSLKSLTIHCTGFASLDGQEETNAHMREINFAPLANCKQLTTFRMQLPFEFYLTREQVIDLTACTSLTQLFCGQWCGSHDWQADDERSIAKWHAEGILMLQSLPLREVSLIGVDMQPVDLVNLSTINTLTSLTPRSWYPTIQDEWSVLMDFPHLQVLNFKLYVPDENNEEEEEFEFDLPIPPPPPNFWIVLMQLNMLAELGLSRIRLTDADLVQLFNQLNRLRKLSIDEVQLESCEAFAEVPPSLEHLMFSEVTTFDRRVIHYHIELPVIPSLRFITISESWGHLLEWPEITEGTQPLRAMMTACKVMLTKRMPYLPIDNIRLENTGT